jgi:hypothetical protein
MCADDGSLIVGEVQAAINSPASSALRGRNAIMMRFPIIMQYGLIILRWKWIPTN